MKRETVKHCAFTLIELLVVIGIIAVLLSILLPAVQRVQKHSKAVVCSSQMRQCGIGFNLYANAWRHTIPFGLCRVQTWDGGSNAALYWDDFLKGVELYGSGQPDWKHAYIPADAVYYCPSNKEADSKTPGIYGSAESDARNPGMGEVTWGSDPTKPSRFPYVKLSGVKSASDFPLLSDSTMAITKFPGRGARIWAPNAWAVAANASSRGMVWLPHSNRANVLFADGHVETSDTERLLTTRIVNSVVAGVTKYGITHWATENLVQQSRPPK